MYPRGAFQLNHEIPARRKNHVCTQKPGPLVTTKPSPSFPGPDRWGQGGDEEGGSEQWVTSWADACCPCPATPHEPGSTSCWCWPVLLSAGILSEPAVCSISISHLRQITWLTRRSCRTSCNRVSESEKKREGRKWLECLITHIKEGTRVAITYMHPRICVSRKRQAWCLKSWFLPLGEDTLWNGQMTWHLVEKMKATAIFF